MERAQKDAAISVVREKFDKMTSAVLVNFKGLNVESITKLRDEFRKSGVEYKVVKNKIVHHAVKGFAWGNLLKTSLVGMTGVAWSYEDPSAAAKVLKAFRKDNEKLEIKVGLLDGQILTSVAVEEQLATMPGKNELRAKLLATMQAPAQQFLQQLNAPLQNFVYLLKAKEDAANAG